MSFEIKDWFAQFKIDSINKINNCISSVNDYSSFKSKYSKIKILSTCLNQPDDIVKYAKSGVKIKEPNGYKSIITKDDYKSLIDQVLKQFDSLEILKPKVNISALFCYSFFIQFKFSLALPYISKDDEEFYICENPIRKDKVFKVPMISGSSWKGNLRWTAMKIFVDKLPKIIKKDELREKLSERAKLVRLFGYEKDTMEDYLNTILAQKLIEEEYKTGNKTINEDIDENKEAKNEKKLKINLVDVIKKEFNELLKEKSYINPNIDGRRGRLNFFPTFFDGISLEVINPHDRKTKAGTQPIYIESVPKGAKGTFSLLYVPFDLLGKFVGEIKSEVIEDLECICEAVKEMMLIYGFSAKKSSGFGVIKDEFEESIFDIKGIDIKDESFRNFSKLEEKIKFIKQKLLGEER